MSEFKTQPAVYPGFAVMEMVYGTCAHKWVGVAAVGTEGATCPQCGLRDDKFIWRGPEPWMSHDGGWLTGYYLLPWWPGQTSGLPETAAEAATTNPASDEIDPYTGEPRNWLRRWLGRLQAAWWALKGEW